MHYFLARECVSHSAHTSRLSSILHHVRGCTHIMMAGGGPASSGPLAAGARAGGALHYVCGVTSPQFVFNRLVLPWGRRGGGGLVSVRRSNARLKRSRAIRWSGKPRRRRCRTAPRRSGLRRRGRWTGRAIRSATQGDGRAGARSRTRWQCRVREDFFRWLLFAQGREDYHRRQVAARLRRWGQREPPVRPCVRVGRQSHLCVHSLAV